ncbi:hypothetical protein [Calothrix sp. CCY 0018]|uniref:hypothetical protein n=1 Tax=Calothrix sp. CCY 0018 TaxID=3103864 RepID=UPI0039C6A516
MSIALEYFCTKTGKPIEVDGKPLIETLENTAAEYLYGNDVKWSIGIVYPGISTEDDLTKHQDKYLQFSKKDRLYFSDKSGLRLQIFDEPHFGAAYGSLLFGECEYFAEVEDIKVLVVDDETGECGGVLPKEQALLLVGDGDGRIDHKLHEQLGNITSTQFQVRGIIKSQEGINANQTIKGTLAPVNLSDVGSGYDLVLSKSQLGKGRKNKLYDEKTGIRINRQTEVQPGEYTLTIGIGNRENARTVEAATGAQYWVGLPKGAENDALPRIQQRLVELDSIANDPRKVALDYIQTVERRLEGDFKRESRTKLIHDFDLDDFGNVINEAFGDKDTELMYQLLKADLEGHLQIIETPKVINFLSEHLQEQYRDCATGRVIRFQSSMLMTCNRLKDWEICDRTKPDGAKVLYHRPPVGNTNVMAVLTNRLLEGEEVNPGSIKLNHRTAAALNSDCDGDKPLTALAENFPNTTQEIEFKTQPENRYPESVLPQKAAYCGSFEKIALEAANDNIGIVANLAMKAIAIESECSQVPDNEQRTFLANLSANLARCASYNLPKEAEHLRELLNDFSEYNHQLTSENQGTKNAFQDYLIPVQEPELKNTLTPDEVTEGLAKVKQLFHHLSGIIDQQLKIEGQSGKSALRSNQEVIKLCTQLCAYPQVYALEDRNEKWAYLDKPIRSNLHTALDLLVQETNQHFESNALTPRPLSQFRDLFRDIDFNSSQLEIAANIKQKYERLIRAAHDIKQEVEANRHQPNLRMVAKSRKGNQIEIRLNQKDTKHPQAYSLSQMQVSLLKENNQYKAFAVIPGETAINKRGQVVPAKKQLGLLTEASVIKNKDAFQILHQKNKNNWIELGKLDININPALNPSHEKAAFKLAYEYAAKSRENIPEKERLAIAAAMWNLSTKRVKEEYDINKRAGAVFAIFGEEIKEQLNQLQFTELTVVGTHRYASEHQGKVWKGEKVPIQIELAPSYIDPSSQGRWLLAEGKKLGMLSPSDAQMIVGAIAKATITSEASTGVTITTPVGNSIEVNKLKSGAFADVDWSKQNYQATVTISVQPSRNPQKPDVGVAMIKDKRLGELKPESFEKLTAVLKAHNIPVQGYTVKGNIIASPPSAAKVIIDANTVEYPESWNQNQQSESSKEKFLLAQQIQANRTLEIAPIIHAFLSTQDKTTVEGKLNTVSWNPQTQEITLWTNGSSSPKMRVKYFDGEYQALPIGDIAEEIAANGLSEVDVQHFQQIAPSIYARVAGNQSIKADNNMENNY